MNILEKVQSLMQKTGGSIETYLHAAVEMAITSYTEDMTESLRGLGAEKPSTLKPMYTPVKDPKKPRNVPTSPFVDILNAIRENEGNQLTYDMIGGLVNATVPQIKYRLNILRNKGIVRAEGSTKDHKGLRYYISRDRKMLEKLV